MTTPQIANLARMSSKAAHYARTTKSVKAVPQASYRWVAKNASHRLPIAKIGIKLISPDVINVIRTITLTQLLGYVTGVWMARFLIVYNATLTQTCHLTSISAQLVPTARTQ